MDFPLKKIQELMHRTQVHLQDYFEVAKTNKKIVLKGDKSLSNRDFTRVIEPLNNWYEN